MVIHGQGVLKFIIASNLYNEFNDLFNYNDITLPVLYRWNSIENKYISFLKQIKSLP